MKAAQALSDELLDFVESLRADGYNIGTSQFINVQNLILLLAARGELPEEPARLRSYLAPLLCNSPEQQAEFERRFQRWSETRELHFQPAPSPVPSPARQTLQRDLSRAGRLSRWLKWGVAALVVAALLVTATLLIPHKDDNETLVPPPPDTVVANPVPTPVVTPPAEEATRHRHIMLWLGALVVLALLVQQLLQYLSARRFLARRITRETPPVAKLLVRGEETQVFDRRLMFRVAQNFRLHRRLGPAFLDIEASVMRTVQDPGEFRRVDTQQLTVPEYLVLVDRLSYRDHQARFFDDLIDWLIEHGVFIHRYYFARDPRVCVPDERYAPRNARPLSLNELESRYPYRRLMIFSDGDALLSPFTGNLESWTDQLDGWPLRALLTPEDPANWGPREDKLTGTGMLVFPATEAGLDALVANPGAAQQWRGRVDDNMRPMPPLLAERADRWTDDHPPDAKVIEDLIQDLRWYLGGASGLLWLTACAVYPELHWPLTLRLGRYLHDEDGQPQLNEERLALLNRLPWFRTGRMPGWLRARLIRDLTPAQRTDIQNVVDALLESALHEPGDAEVLEIALDNPVPALGRRIFGMLRRRESKDSPLREHVFATFMSDRLAVPVPPLLQRFFSAVGPTGGVLEDAVRRLRNATRLLIGSAATAWLLLILADRVGSHSAVLHFLAAAMMYSTGVSLIILAEVVRHKLVRAAAAYFVGIALFTVIAEGLSPGAEPLWRKVAEFVLAGGGVLIMLPAWNQWRGVRASAIRLGTLRIGQRLILLSLVACLLPAAATLLAVIHVGGATVLGVVAGVHVLPLSGALIVLGWSTQTRGLVSLGFLFPIASIAAYALIAGFAFLVTGSLGYGVGLTLGAAGFLVMLVRRSTGWYKRVRPVLAGEGAGETQAAASAADDPAARTMRNAARVLLLASLPLWLIVAVAPIDRLLSMLILTLGGLPQTTAQVLSLIVLYLLSAMLFAVGLAGANQPLRWFGGISTGAIALTLIFGWGTSGSWSGPAALISSAALSYMVTVGGYLWLRAWRRGYVSVPGGMEAHARVWARRFMLVAGCTLLVYAAGLLIVAVWIHYDHSFLAFPWAPALIATWYVGAQAVPLTVALLLAGRAGGLRPAAWLGSLTITALLAQIPALWTAIHAVDRNRWSLPAAALVVVCELYTAGVAVAGLRWYRATGASPAAYERQDRAWRRARGLMRWSAAAQLISLIAIILFFAANLLASGEASTTLLIAIPIAVAAVSVPIAAAQALYGRAARLMHAWFHAGLALAGAALQYVLAASIEQTDGLRGAGMAVTSAGFVISVIVLGFHWYATTPAESAGEIEGASSLLDIAAPRSNLLGTVLRALVFAFVAGLALALLDWTIG